MTAPHAPRLDGDRAVEEWVSAASAETVARTLVETARRFCG
jgi:hypothetical protein